MKYVLYIIVGIVITNLLIKINKKIKYKKLVSKNRNIENGTTIALNDETTPLYESNVKGSRYKLKIEKDIVVVHSDITID